MFNSKLFTILFAVVTWIELCCIPTSSTIHNLGRRYKRYTNSENCGILPTEHGQQIGASNSLEENSLQGDGIVNKNKSLHSQILGGETSTFIWPWMVQILYEGLLACGGTAIDERHIVTAAHCFFLPPDGPQLNTRDFSIQALKLSRGDPSHDYKIEGMEMHKGFKLITPNVSNDIAILRLDSPLPSDVIPICLPTEDALTEGNNLTLLGWGLTEAVGNDSFPDVLQEIHDLHYMSSEHCQEIISSVTDSQFCSRNPEGDKGPCKGDSGGPVLYQNQLGQYELVGVVSWGPECGSSEVASVYTRVFSYLQWIHHFIANGEKEENSEEGEDDVV